MPDNILQTDSVTRVFKAGREEVRALDQVTVDIPAARLTMLRGRSGSGKTTLINICGALDRPTSGTVRFQDKDVTGAGDRERDELRRTGMGFVFQSIALINTMTALENIEFGLRVAGFDPAERRDRALECLTLVGLENRVKHRIQELSGGEQQRVAIARAVAHRPALVFADEPTAELDTAMGLQVVRLFRDLIDKESLTLVMTTHDPNMIELADRVYTLEDGRITHVDG
ncbi:MAG: ABC transporter ATP-binding protein [Clostridiaceae bacterium]|nr:ABC transporter ATP-binding protein [Clostridiaceae bacterium]